MESKENINSNRNDLLLQIGKELHQIIGFIQTNSEILENIEMESNLKGKQRKNEIKLGLKHENFIDLDKYEDEKEINLKENIEYENKEMEKISLKNKKLKSKLNKYKR